MRMTPRLDILSTVKTTIAYQLCKLCLEYNHALMLLDQLVNQLSIQLRSIERVNVKQAQTQDTNSLATKSLSMTFMNKMEFLQYSGNSLTLIDMFMTKT